MNEKVVLKKYTNRRLYDTGRSEYVTLSRVADLIRQGRRVEVIDAKTKEDVTGFILTQIILEEARNRNALLPVPLLHLIIQYGGNVLDEFFQNYLQQTLENYLKYKSAADAQFKKWLELGMDLSGAAQKAMTGLSPLQSFFDQFAPSRKDGPDKTEKSD
jgi:polyhydroxyalkanoate synthesis repressor PhaR